jgi:hypothetical protein
MQVSIENSDAQEVQIRVGTTESKEADIRDSYTKTEDRVDTTLIIPDGETRVISGLLRKDNSDSESGVPFLYKIPVLGTLLFGRKSAGEETRNLVFFITPVIVREKTSDDLIAYRFDPQEPMPFGSDVEKAPLQKDDAALTSSTASDIFEGVLPMESLSPQQYQDAANLKATGSENSEAALREMFGGKMPATSTEAKILKPGTSATVEAPKGSVSKPAAKPDPAAASGATPQAKPAKSEADNAKKGGDKKPQKKPRTGVGSPNRTTRKP